MPHDKILNQLKTSEFLAKERVRQKSFKIAVLPFLRDYFNISYNPPQDFVNKIVTSTTVLSFKEFFWDSEPNFDIIFSCETCSFRIKHKDYYSERYVWLKGKRWNRWKKLKNPSHLQSLIEKGKVYEVYNVD